MSLFTGIQNAIEKHSNRNAFCLNGEFYSYMNLAGVISRIRKAIRSNTVQTDKNIALVANDDIETYAAIIALWLEGKAYVPINPKAPAERNDKIILQASVRTIIDSSKASIFEGINLIASHKLTECEIDLTPVEVSDKELVYILFTSGTTGQPKGVPITRANLKGFIEAFWKIGFRIDYNDRCLQMCELTFDLSVISFLVPILKGACQYTIPKNKIKYSYIFELMEEQKLTFAPMVPSVLYYLRPYFNEVHFPDMRYSLFCGEALPLDITEEWSKCLPKAEIYNVYGPTENTVFCTSYKFNRVQGNKTYNGVLSIGKAMQGTETIIVDENDTELAAGEKGQLCLGSVQLTPGYWCNDKKNKEAFFTLPRNHREKRFYKTGDLCVMDTEGDISYLGRIDLQVKIQGFRVELSEIEFHVKIFLPKTNIVALAFTDSNGIADVGLVVESKVFDTMPLLEYLKIKLPAYMLPKKITFMDKFPLNINGKTDRKKMEMIFTITQNA